MMEILHDVYPHLNLVISYQLLTLIITQTEKNYTSHHLIEKGLRRVFVPQ